MHGYDVHKAFCLTCEIGTWVQGFELDDYDLIVEMYKTLENLLLYSNKYLRKLNGYNVHKDLNLNCEMHCSWVRGSGPW